VVPVVPVVPVVQAGLADQVAQAGLADLVVLARTELQADPEELLLLFRM
jgi:hypothetical protein